MTTLTCTKESATLLKWLNKATTKGDPRPVLQALYFNSSVIGCDGFRLHAAKNPTELEGNYKVNPVPNASTEAEHIDGTTPDYVQIVPTYHDHCAAPSFYINSKLLQEALAGMDGCVKIVVHGDGKKPCEVLGVDKDDNPLYALITPMYGENLDRYWRPY